MGYVRGSAHDRDPSPFGRLRQRIRQGFRPCLRAGDRRAYRRPDDSLMRRRPLLAFPAVAVVAGCAGGPPAPAVVNLTIKAGPDLNRNAAGTPLAVALRV